MRALWLSQRRCISAGWGLLRKLTLAWSVILLILTTDAPVLAQEEDWTPPVMLSTTTRSSWFPDIAVDGWGQPYVVWNSGRPTQDRGQMDLLMFSTMSQGNWTEPNDIVVTAFGGYTIRPAVAVDNAGVLHITYRGKTTIYYASAPSAVASLPSSWEPKRISGSGGGYYSDIAVDDAGTIHVVWNEGAAQGAAERRLWFGTAAGIALLEGDHWPSEEALAVLGNRYIQDVIEDRNGLQWIATSVGVSSYDGYALRALDSVTETVRCMLLGADNSLWLGTDMAVLHGTYDDRGELSWALHTPAEGLPDGPVNAMAIDLRGTVWVATETGLGSLVDGAWGRYSPLPGAETVEIRDLAVDGQGSIWAATRRGAMRFDGKTWRVFTVADGLTSDSVSVIEADRAGGVWIGTDHGLSRWDGQSLASFGDEPALTDLAVTALLVDSQGALWVGTYGGVRRYVSRQWSSHNLPAEFGRVPVTVISEDQQVNAICPLCADVYYRRSTDGGVTWSAPTNLSQSFPGSVKPQIRIGEDSEVYVTWEEGEDWYLYQGRPVGSMFAHSPDGGVSWDQRTSFLPVAHGTPQQITMALDRDQRVVVIWRPAEGDTYYYQISATRGRSWSQPQAIPGIIAKPWRNFSLDAYDAATDSAGNIHLLVLGYQSSQTEDLGLWHLVWNGYRWSEPRLIYASSDPPEWPRIDVGAGNRVFATWFTRDAEHIFDTEQGQYKIWVSSYRSSAPSTEPLRPTLTPSEALPTVEVTTTPGAPTPTPTIELNGPPLPSGLYSESDEIATLLAAILPILLIVLVLFATRFGWFRRRR